MEKYLEEITRDFEWLRKVITNENNLHFHYDGIKILIRNFSLKWKHISKRHPNLYHSYVNYLRLKLRFEYEVE